MKPQIYTDKYGFLEDKTDKAKLSLSEFYPCLSVLICG